MHERKNKPGGNLTRGPSGGGKPLGVFVVAVFPVVLAIVPIAWFKRELKNDCAAADPERRGVVDSGEKSFTALWVYTRVHRDHEG